MLLFQFCLLCLNLTTTRHNSCLSPQKELSISLCLCLYAYIYIPIYFNQYLLCTNSLQSMKNLGFTLDCHPTTNEHVSAISRTFYFELRRMASIRRFLTRTTATPLSHLFCQELTIVTHCCLVLLRMQQRTFIGCRIMQLE